MHQTHMSWDHNTYRFFDEHKFWLPEREKADGDYPVAKEREIRMLNLMLSAIETPSRFVLSYELYDFVHTRMIRKPSKILRYARKSELPPFYFFICKN